MNSILVVTYSYTGTSRRLGQLLSAQQGWPLGEVLEEQGRSGASGTPRCVLDSLLRRCPAVRYQGPDLVNFRTVVLVSPIWVYRLAGPMRSFIVDHKAELRRVASVSTMGSRGATNAIAEIGQVLRQTPVLSAAFTSREVEDGSCAQRLRAFGDALRLASMDAEPIRAVT